jgi:hypothetical protein
MWYFVTGVARSGTTWMMQALHNGGMPIFGFQNRLESLEKFALTPGTEGMVQKVFITDLNKKDINDQCSIVMMYRSPENISASQQRNGNWGEEKHAAWLKAGTYEEMFAESRNKYEEVGADVHVCNLESVAKGGDYTINFFCGLTNAGWPLMPYLCAETGKIK